MVPLPVRQPEPVRRRAAEQSGCILLEDGRADRALRGPSYFFADPIETLTAHTLDELPALFRQIEAARSADLWAAGYVGYECGFHWEPHAAPDFSPGAGDMPLAAFGLYREPEMFVAGTAAALPGLQRETNAWTFGISEAEFRKKVDAIRAWIEAGDTYQLNLTDCFTTTTAPAPHLLFAQMMQAQPVAYGALLHLGEQQILSVSPELFFRREGRSITVRPMKGTAPRGRDAAEDCVRMQALALDEKNRAENLMIVDLLRSDLGRIAEMGSVRVDKLFEIERFSTLLQMSSEISATLRPEIEAYAMFAALFPSGSIVGAPKVRSMQILRQLEGRSRGVYTGAIGYFTPSRAATERAVFSVAIRTAVLHGQDAVMGAGAGITYSSEPAAEYAECLLKADFLREEQFELIETLRVKDKACALLERHLSRLAASAAYFEFAFSQAHIRSAVENAVVSVPSAEPWRLRLTLDRSGSLLFGEPVRILPDEGPLRAMVWPEAVASQDRFLRHKTTRRSLYDRALAHAQVRGYVDAVFLNEHAHVAEGAIHCIMVRHGCRWRTPPLGAGVLPGVFRAHLLATMPELEEADIALEELLTGDEIWLTNAVRGIRRVTLAAPAAHAIVRS